MKIKLTCHISDFFYKGPIIIQSHTLKKNQLLSIAFYYDNKFLDSIDLCALPLFHQYNLNEWRYVLENFFTLNDLNLNEIKLDRPYFNMLSLNNIPEIEGELLFIIESILFKIIEKLKPDHLNSFNKNSIKTNDLFDYNQMINSQINSVSECVKIKIRPTKKNLNETIAIIKFIMNRRAETKLRLDGNRFFELLNLCEFMTQLEQEFGSSIIQVIEYIEEPFKNANDIHLFAQYSHYNIAIDESLIHYNNQLHLLLNLPGKFSLVIKPSLFGISKSFEIVNFAASINHNAVISSSYEPISALNPFFYLAATNSKTFHGLDTLKYLPKNLGIFHHN